MSADRNQTELDRRALAISVWENEGGRERRTRLMVNPVAASKWVAPGRSIASPPASERVARARHWPTLADRRRPLMAEDDQGAALLDRGANLPTRIYGCERTSPRPELPASISTQFNRPRSSSHRARNVVAVAAIR